MSNSEIVKRAATGLRIAQLKFRQALLKQDGSANGLPVVPQDSSSQFCADLDAVFARNTPLNVQTCKEWILRHIAPSKIRIILLGEYLVAVSKSHIVEPHSKPGKAIRNRLDIILVINDVLHSDKFHNRSGGVVAESLGPYIGDLAELVASYLQEKDTKFEKTLRAVFKYWRVNELLSPEVVDSTVERTHKMLRVAQGDALPEPEKRVYTLPEWFGDRAAPWSDLPASYMLEPMLKHRDRPIDASETRIRRFKEKQPSERVCELLDDYFENVDLCYKPSHSNPMGDNVTYKLWLDRMGHMVKQDKKSGSKSAMANGYGWSTGICEDMDEEGMPQDVMKARADYASTRRGFDAPDYDTRRRRHSSDRSRSPSRRRYSSSGSEYDRRKRPRSRSRTRSRSRSSYDSRDDRPSTRDSDRSYGASRQQGRSEDKNYNERRHDSNNNIKDLDQRRPPTDSHPRVPSQPNNLSNWQGHNASNQNNYSGPPNPNIFPNPGNNYGQPYAPGFQPPPAPPAPPQYPGQFMPPFQPPFSGPPGGPMPGMPAPPNFNGPFPNAYPPLGGFPGNFGNNNFANNPGFGGFNPGGFQGNNFNGRGGYRGNNQRGRGSGGSRWN